MGSLLFLLKTLLSLDVDIFCAILCASSKEQYGGGGKVDPFYCTSRTLAQSALVPALVIHMALEAVASLWS